ncbi:Flp family type IVb pilin [Phreatobacter stygius]|uniref:Flp family type IVb pilin n=1 Tax=Phreatobacter stygius TaxID=1940610 RepID=A0A4D7AVG9_9HYPH|nr:Flp family type IVb pilin [Phreatobacter stygius]QCI64949.1 Flp family type IVb pilin [Phreatobacter stygius]
MRACIARFLRDNSGATAMEYGLIIAALAAAIIVVMFSIGNKIKDMFVFIEGNLSR